MTIVADSDALLAIFFVFNFKLNPRAGPFPGNPPRAAPPGGTCVANVWGAASPGPQLPARAGADFAVLTGWPERRVVELLKTRQGKTRQTH